MSRAGWGLLILLFATAGGMGSFVGSAAIEPVYEATTTLLVGDVTDAPELTKDDIETSATLAATYGSLIRSQPVLGGVADDLDLQASWQELKERVHVDLGVNDIPLITVSVFASSAAEAETITAAIAEQAIAISPAGVGDRRADESQGFVSRQARELERAIRRGERRIARLEEAIGSARTPVAKAGLQTKIDKHLELIIGWQGIYISLAQLSAGGSPNILRVLQPAEASTAPVRPDMSANTALGAAIGALAGLGIAYVSLLLRRRAPAHANGQGVSVLKREETHPDQTPTGDQATKVHVPDPWVRELADPNEEMP
jgi:tyrosine-protein kinase